MDRLYIKRNFIHTLVPDVILESSAPRTNTSVILVQFWASPLSHYETRNHYSVDLGKSLGDGELDLQGAFQPSPQSCTISASRRRSSIIVMSTCPSSRNSRTNHLYLGLWFISMLHLGNYGECSYYCRPSMGKGFPLIDEANRI